MNPTNIRKRDPLEEEILQKIKRKLLLAGWTIMRTHGSQYQHGFPDLYVFKYERGQRWIEVKRPKNYKFTPAQYKYFPLMSAAGIGIWILTADTEDQIALLDSPPNWMFFLSIFKSLKRTK